jgi:hypothetical protein
VGWGSAKAVKLSLKCFVEMQRFLSLARTLPPRRLATWQALAASDFATLSGRVF